MIAYRQWQRERLEETINWLEGYLAACPSMTSTEGYGRREAWNQRLAHDLIEIAGATCVTAASNGVHTIVLFGLKARSTAGLSDACKTWSSKAQRMFPA